MISVRLLRIRCTSWDQVAAFYTRKLRKQRFLSLRVPFAAEPDVPVTVGLELPTGVVVALDGVVRAVTLHADNPHPMVELELTGDIAAQVERLQEMVAAAAKSTATDASQAALDQIDQINQIDRVEPETEQARESESEPKPEADPAVAPRAETSGVVVVPDAHIVDHGDASAAIAISRRLSVRSLDHRLAALRDMSVAQVLGIASDATYEQAVAARLRLRREFGVVYNRPAQAAFRQVNEEILILVERAFTQFVLGLGDAAAHRLRNYRVLVEQGSYFLGAGPDRSDVEIPSTPSLDVDALFGDMSQVMGDDASREVAISGQRNPTNEALSKSRRLLATGEAETARTLLTAALREDPKSRALRALFHVAGAVLALQAGNGAQAISQLETATLYDESCREAKSLLDIIAARTTVDDSQLTRLFQ
ncbi:MAG: hypothetical protein IPL79_08710 [Myxococcales bacterium]|nr:hypothetical protein [Myxococcales bacterium]